MRDEQKAYKLTEAMTGEIRRLVINLNWANQQFNQFINYCRAEVDAPQDWQLDLDKLEFVQPQRPKADIVPIRKSDKENVEG